MFLEKLYHFTFPREVYDASSSSKSLPVLGGSVFVISAIPVDVNSGISLIFYGNAVSPTCFINTVSQKM